jgi:hypothetical protein
MDDVVVSHGDRGTQVVMRRQLGSVPPEPQVRHEVQEQEVPA